MRNFPRSYEVTIEKRPAFAYALLTAEKIDVSDAGKYIGELAEECSHLSADKLLIDRHVSALPSRTFAYEKISVITQLFPDGTHIAIVDADAEARDRFEWGIGHHDAGGTIKTFATVDEAEQWLTG